MIWPFKNRIPVTVTKARRLNTPEVNRAISATLAYFMYYYDSDSNSDPGVKAQRFVKHALDGDSDPGSYEQMLKFLRGPFREEFEYQLQAIIGAKNEMLYDDEKGLWVEKRE